jgi:Family of unknown function (DUF5678)
VSSDTEYSAPAFPKGAERYAGKWVAIRGDEVVAGADSLEELLANELVSPDDALWIVPEAGTYFL